MAPSSKRRVSENRSVGACRASGTINQFKQSNSSRERGLVFREALKGHGEVVACYSDLMSCDHILAVAY